MDALAKLGFVVMGIALCVAGFAALIAFGDGRLSGDGPLWTLAISLGIGVLPLPLQWRRDAAATAMFVVVFALIGMLPGIVSMLLGQGSSRALGLSAVCTVIFVAGVAFLIRSQYGREALPNPLVDLFGKEHILEYEGVQFVVIAPEAVATGEPFALEVHVQNCWNGARTFGFELRPTPGLKMHEKPTIELQPLEVGVMAIPFVATGASGPLNLGADPWVAGSGGARLRTRRGHLVQRKVSTGMQVAALAAGHLVWGGGLTWTFEVQPGSRAPEPRLSEVGWTSVWPTLEDRAALTGPG